MSVQQTSHPFVWPPRRGAPAPDAHAPLSTADPHQPSRHLHGPRMLEALARRPAPWMVDIERVWLDTTAAPLGERIAQTGWCPDVSDAYCARCGRTLSHAEPAGTGCQACADTRPGWHRLVRLGAYDEPLRTWVHEVKFTRWRRLGTDLGRLLGAAVHDELDRLRSHPQSGSLGSILDRPPIVIPMPTTFTRLLSRGIDHAKAIARGVASEINGELTQPLRRSRRPSQTEVAPSSRGTNISRSIRAKHARSCHHLDRRLIVLVDDVTTTGSTLRAACRALREGGVSPERSLVWVAVVGVAGREQLAESSAGVGDRPNA